MDARQLRRLKPELDSFLDRYAPLFGRVENHEHARRFVQGLLAGGERRNVENIAEQVVGGDSLYGDSPTFVQGVSALGKWYVLDASRDARVWTT